MLLSVTWHNKIISLGDFLGSYDYQAQDREAIITWFHSWNNLFLTILLYCFGNKDADSWSNSYKVSGYSQADSWVPFCYYKVSIFKYLFSISCISLCIQVFLHTLKQIKNPLWYLLSTRYRNITHLWLEGAFKDNDDPWQGYPSLDQNVKPDVGHFWWWDIHNLSEHPIPVSQHPPWKRFYP